LRPIQAQILQADRQTLSLAAQARLLQSEFKVRLIYVCSSVEGRELMAK
jgi:hypothetical protein